MWTAVVEKLYIYSRPYWRRMMGICFLTMAEILKKYYITKYRATVQCSLYRSLKGVLKVLIKDDNSASLQKKTD